MYRPLALAALVSFFFIPQRTGAQPCMPSPEVCDGMDNDCDEAVDEPPLLDAPPAGQTGCWNLPGNCCSFASMQWCPPFGGNCNDAGTLTSPCAAGTITCDEGAWTCANPVRPTTEVCDGVDNNCNGVADDATQAGTACTTGVGACETDGVLMCSMAGASCSATAGEPSTELCENGIDDDCNGETDEGFTLGASCTVGVGACEATGTHICDGGSEYCDATEGAPAGGETCGNGIDDDCDEFTDEGFMLGETCTVGVGACAVTGVTICDGLGTTCDATANAPGASEVCGNGIDDDCSGVVDDGCVTDDGGVDEDAGTSDDAGVAEDAGVTDDAGVDASVPAGGNTSGCSCRASATGSPIGFRVIALGLMAIVLTRRGRRARG